MKNLTLSQARPFIAHLEKKIIFSSNHHRARGFNFNLFTINKDGTGLKQISYDPVFDAFPVFSSKRKKIIFSSNKNNGGTKDTNILIANWEE